MSTQPSIAVKCVSCGKFIPHDDLTSGAAHFHFEPDNHFGPEVSEWECAKCRPQPKAGS